MPATVQAVLAARIDRLPPVEKQLLQTAAVIGAAVPLALLQAIAELPEDIMYRGLAHLQAAEFLYETRLFPEREYTLGMATAKEGVRIAEEVNHPLSRIAAYDGVGIVSFFKGDLHQAISVLERGLALFQSLYIPAWSTFYPLLGAAYALSGRLAEALPWLEQAVEHANTRELIAHQALWLAHLSEAYLLAGRLDDAYTRAGQALEFARGHKGRGHEAYAMRLLGEVAAQREPLDIDHATTHYRQALALAEELGMRPLQAHCHRGVGTLYVKIGWREQARLALSAAIALYRTMDMTFGLPQTEVALAQVTERLWTIMSSLH